MSESGTFVTGAGAKTPSAPGLLDRFLAGDRVAIRQVEDWARQVIRYDYYNALKHEADQIVQDTVDDVYHATSKDGFVLRTNLRALVHTIARRRCIDSMRKRRPTVSPDEGIEWPGCSPYEDVLRNDERARLRWAIINLDLPCQMVIREHWFEGRTYPEIAGIYGKAAGTYAWLMHKCMQKLAAMLAAAGGEGRQGQFDDQDANA
jgi:RNA polymerase sigma factor (sigma-70 family)